jgi:hypothetical protein
MARDNVFPPGLRAYVAQEQLGQNNQAQKLGMLAQLMNLQGQMQDRQLQQQMMPLKLEGMLAELEDRKAKVAQSQARGAFFSPENQQNYMEGGRPEISLPEDMQGPVSAAVPGQMNMGRFMQDAAARNHIPPETYFNHQQQVAQRQQAAELQAQTRREQIEGEIQREKIRSEDRNLALAERDESRRRGEALQVMLANQSQANARQIAQMGIDGRREAAQFALANRAPPQPQAPTLVYRQEPDGSTTAVDFRTGKEMQGVMPAGAATAGAKAAVTKKVSQTGVQEAFDQVFSILDSKDPATGAPTEKPTGSGIGSLVDTAGRFIGVNPSGSVPAAKLKTLSATLASKAPRFEGPQSDKDVKLYSEMMGMVGDDTKTVAERVAAAQTAHSLHVKYDKPGGSATPSNAPAAPSKVRKYNPATGKIE